MNVPLYFHNAVFYQKENYHFVNPIFEGIYETLYRDLLPWIKKRGLGYVAHGFLRGLVKAWVTFEYVEVICKNEKEEEEFKDESKEDGDQIIPINDITNNGITDGTATATPTTITNNVNTPIPGCHENDHLDRPSSSYNSTTPTNPYPRSESPNMNSGCSSNGDDDFKSVKSEFDSGDEYSSSSPRLSQQFDSGNEDEQSVKSDSVSQKKIIYQLPKKDGRPYATVRWKGLDMMYPISDTMKNFYNSKNYKKLKQEYIGSGIFWIDSSTNGLLTEKDWQMAVYANDVDTREINQKKFKFNQVSSPSTVEKN